MDLSNYKYDSSKVWTREKNFAFGYSEGDETENELLRKIESITDRRVLSPEMLKIQDDWPSLYHFSSLRANLLRPFFSRIQKSKILELGCGLGALTRYLGEAGAKLYTQLREVINGRLLRHQGAVILPMFRSLMTRSTIW